MLQLVMSVRSSIHTELPACVKELLISLCVIFIVANYSQRGSVHVRVCVFTFNANEPACLAKRLTHFPKGGPKGLTHMRAHTHIHTQNHKVVGMSIRSHDHISQPHLES